MDNWDRALDRVIPNVVRVKYYSPHAFDAAEAAASQATGFVVDAEKGLILTNRHVVGPGPFVGHCVFDSREEVACRAIYRDPIHDFGFLQYDPKAVKFAEIDGLVLAPDQAKVGTEFRIVGNDAGEDLSILSGFISRIDRNAPEYDGVGYNDFNTCYYQANASATGGSSGSPVVTKDGTVVALQAGGRTDNASTDYFLPLHRPLRALRCIQKGIPVTRGDIQCQFVLKQFEKSKGLGLSDELEREIREALPNETSMLVAEMVLPDGPSDTNIEVGDVLIRVNGELLTQFVRLEEILDASVGGTVELLLQRGGKDKTVEIEVGNLHDITPDRFVSVAGASFHNLSYLQACSHGVACQGVYVCDTSPSFSLGHNNTGWILDKVNHEEVPDLETFIEIAKDIPDRALVLVNYHHLSDPNTSCSKEIYFFNKHFYAMTEAVRNDKTGLWDFTKLGDPTRVETPKRQTASFITMGQEALPYPSLQELHHSFVLVECAIPLLLNSLPNDRTRAMGIVIDAEEGLVGVSSTIVPHSCCDITITIAGTIIVEAQVQSVHPTVNLTVVKYDPSLVGAPVKSVRLSRNKLCQGAETFFFGYNDNSDDAVFAPTTVAEISTVAVPATVHTPRYRAVNLEGIKIDSRLGSECTSGVLVDSDGAVEALWLAFMGEDEEEFRRGLSTRTLRPVLDAIQQGKDAELRLLPVELSSISMAQASARGISKAQIDMVMEASPSRHQLFEVRRCAAQDTSLMVDDVVLTLNGKICTTFSDFDVMYDNEQLYAVIVRDGKEKSIVLSTVAANANETTRAVSFCGVLLQPPHAAARQQIRKTPPSQVYVSSGQCGSPGQCYGIYPGTFITKVNGQPTPDLDAFIAVTKKIAHGTSLRVSVESLRGIPSVVTMKTNHHYFPLVEWTKNSKGKGGQWRKVTHTTSGEGSEQTNE